MSTSTAVALGLAHGSTRPATHTPRPPQLSAKQIQPYSNSNAAAVGSSSGSALLAGTATSSGGVLTPTIAVTRAGELHTPLPPQHTAADVVEALRANLVRRLGVPKTAASSSSHEAGRGGDDDGDLSAQIEALAALCRRSLLALGGVVGGDVGGGSMTTAGGGYGAAGVGGDPSVGGLLLADASANNASSSTLPPIHQTSTTNGGGHHSGSDNGLNDTRNSATNGFGGNAVAGGGSPSSMRIAVNAPPASVSHPAGGGGGGKAAAPAVPLSAMPTAALVALASEGDLGITPSAILVAQHVLVANGGGDGGSAWQVLRPGTAGGSNDGGHDHQYVSSQQMLLSGSTNGIRRTSMQQSPRSGTGGNGGRLGTANTTGSKRTSPRTPRNGGRGGGGGLGGSSGINGVPMGAGIGPNGQLEPLSMGQGAALTQKETASYGQCISATCYFLLESILVRTMSDRLSLFVRNDADQLCLVANVGLGTHQVTRETPVSTSGLPQYVYNTRIAANLARADLDDLAECRGPTVGKNTIAFPIRSVEHPYGKPFGVLQLVNKKKGTESYTSADELLLHCVGPSIACILERYPTRLPHFGFDIAPLHRWSPLPNYTAPEIGLVDSLSTEPPQLIYHRGDEGRFARKQWMQLARDINTTTAATHLEDIEKHLALMEDCWRTSIADTMRLERLLLQKEHHIHDARDIINRKQKKLEVMKNVLCDEIGRHLKGESALTKGPGM